MSATVSLYTTAAKRVRNIRQRLHNTYPESLPRARTCVVLPRQNDRPRGDFTHKLRIMRLRISAASGQCTVPWTKTTKIYDHWWSVHNRTCVKHRSWFVECLGVNTVFVMHRSARQNVVVLRQSVHHTFAHFTFKALFSRSSRHNNTVKPLLALLEQDRKTLHLLDY